MCIRDSIKAYWVMYGKATTELALAFGADDIDGTIDDTTKIYSMAGADDRRPSMSVEAVSYTHLHTRSSLRISITLSAKAQSGLSRS